MTSAGVSIIGGGGHAKVVVATLTAAGVSVDAIFDDDAKKAGTRIMGVPVKGAVADAAATRGPAIIGIGSNAARRLLAAKLSVPWAVAVHPSSIVHPSATIGHGTVVFAGAIVQPDSRIGEHVIVNTGACIDHDCHVGDFSHIAPGAVLTGNVTIGEGAMIGAGAVITPGRSVGQGATVGAGAVVVEDIPPYAVAMGVPARVTRFLPSPSERDPS